MSAGSNCWCPPSHRHGRGGGGCGCCFRAKRVLVPTPSRPAGLSGDAGPTPAGFRAWEARTDHVIEDIHFGAQRVRVGEHYIAAAPSVEGDVDLGAAVERVGQLEALVRLLANGTVEALSATCVSWISDTPCSCGCPRMLRTVTPLAEVRPDLHAVLVETLEKGTPE